jgi:hypothetical protein
MTLIGMLQGRAGKPLPSREPRDGSGDNWGAGTVEDANTLPVLLKCRA